MFKHKFKSEDISEAITFMPNEDEFKEPLEYIEKIRPMAEQYGICKIIPPRHWKPPFCIDMYNFKFRPRVQKLNELEANTRIRLNFIEKLSKFWELQGKKFKIPIVEGKQLDLYKLYKIVESLGSYESVTKNKKWAQLSKQLHYRDNYTCTTIKMHYENLLYPFLLFEAGVTLPNTKSSDSSICLDTEQQQQKLKQKSNKSKNKIDTEKIEQIKCLVCSRGDDEAFMLLCDGCDDSYHTFCLYPPLKEIPKGDWRCPVCVAAICKKPTDDYGFEQSKKEYNLIEFGKMAAKFKQEFFKKNPELISAQECENEFWKILNSDETVEVEYGADLHTLETGSGFPTRSNRGKFKENDQPYVDSPWNLNNLSMLDKSVLSQMNVEISGMKIPWAYVGMCFSCFCWHVEDHWSYSINYLHMGDIKTWYGVSGNDADKFEKAMKQNANELFENTPDLLHHLVTIMNPTLLKENGVPIFRINQKAGEFVITFPRAYHAGFNQGFNFAEAVNFCPADWMPLGRAAIEHYKLVKRHTVFSHDELVCKVALNGNVLDINTSLALQNELRIMIDWERENRKLLLEKGVKSARKLAFEMLSDDERTCDYCKTTCFVSAVNCACRPDVLVCLNHSDFLCDTTSNGGGHRLSVLYRYEMQELYSMYSKLKQHTDEYFKWCKQVEYFLDLGPEEKDKDLEIIEEKEKPHLNQLIKLNKEAKEKKYPTKLVKELDKELNLALNCVKLCKKYLNLFKENESKKKEEEDAKSDPESTNSDEIIFVKKTQGLRQRAQLEKLKNLSADLAKLKCKIDESDLFLKIVEEAISYEIKIKDMIKQWNTDSPEEIKSVLDYLDRIEIEFPLLMVEQLRLMYKQSVWLEKVNSSVQEPSKFSIRIIKDFIDEFTNDNLLSSFSHDQKCNETIQKSFVDLQELLSIAQTWDEKARKQIESKNKISTFEELETTLKEAKFIPVQMDNVKRLENLLKNAEKINTQAENLLKDPSYPYLSDLKEIQKNCQEVPVMFSFMPTLDTRIDLANEWIGKLENLFLKSDTHANLLDILTPRLDLVNIITKLQQGLASNLSNSPTSSQTKKQKIKSLQTVVTNQPTPLISVENSQEFYKEKNFATLTEKYKSLQIKELDLIKNIRKLNTDRLMIIKNHLETPVDSTQKETISINKIKCTCCSNSILNRLQSNQQIQECKLCLAVYCLSCCSCNSSLGLCLNCDRSNKPNFDLVVNSLVLFEKFELRSHEANALQMFTSRVLVWIDKYDKLLNENTDVRDLIENSENLTAEMFDQSLNPLKRAELIDLHLESLLIGVDNEKMNKLNQFFKFLNKNTELEQLKILAEKSNEFKKSTSETKTKGLKTTKSKNNLNNTSTGEENQKLNSLLKSEKVTKKSKEEQQSSTNSKGRKRDISQVDYDTAEEEYCAALKCVKPSGDNIKWVQCDGDCNKWFHMLCVGITKIKRKEKYLCHLCNQNSNHDESSNSSSSSSSLKTILANQQRKNSDISTPDMSISNNNNNNQNTTGLLASELNDTTNKLNDSVKLEISMENAS